jgi:hypothetical protein
MSSSSAFIAKLRLSDMSRVEYWELSIVLRANVHPEDGNCSVCRNAGQLYLTQLLPESRSFILFTVSSWMNFMDGNSFILRQSAVGLCTV